MAWQHTERSKLLPESNIFVVSGRNRQRSKCCTCLTMILVYGSLFFAAASLIAFFTTGLYNYPIHASCRIHWTIERSCNDTQVALINQMVLWSTNETCASGGEKCLYKYLSSTNTTVIGTHETPVKHYIDDLKFNLDPLSTNTCSVQGHSSSQLWYAVLDYGTNYCNLHNLIVGANLHEGTTFSESTRDAICTQYSSANCEVY